jgi:glycosyltransferase involved in cell wall biosynthesis
MKRIDWGTILELSNQHVVFEHGVCSTRPRVTIGLPTYRRAQTIRRALSSIANQTYRDFVLIVSDNAGEEPSTLAAVKEYSTNLPAVILIAQSENIGALQNLQYLLAISNTEYFMWLADDDEISPDYLEELVNILDKDPSVVTAMGQWKSMRSPDHGYIRSQLRPESNSRMTRLFHFVAGSADDSAFYGLHRTRCIRDCRFIDFLPPNRGVLTNFCYVILFDQLLQGRFGYSHKAAWICHNYSEKHYEKALARGATDRLKTLLRRANVYCIYVGKTGRRAPWLFPVVAAASIFGLSRDISMAVVRLTLATLRQRLSSQPSGPRF